MGEKEAVIKASGLGVSKELNEVNTLPDCIQVNGQDFSQTKSLSQNFIKFS